ncbi:putative nuclease HARBI1 [Saccostrea cucullata]|uniref:putative nuclease HARBI1 n=1 Tax=Saccostrea cuccullata TaxID=36930 RepID=UPI002ED12CC3
MDRVLTSLCHHLQNIKFPSGGEEIRRSKTDFFGKAGFPNVLGAIDGTLIKIQAPSENEPSYVCRKGFHALNVQAVADASLRFTDLVCKWPGAVHDSFVFKNSNLNNILSQGCSGWLLGDSGYPLKSYLMTPVNNPKNQQEENYNSSHCRTRVVVERVFGVLKPRFRCLHPTGGVLLFSIQKCIHTIVACFKLHNKCIQDKIPIPDVDCDADTQDEEVINNLQVNAAGNQIRQRVIQLF